MLEMLGDYFRKGPQKKSGPAVSHPFPNGASPQGAPALRRDTERKATFSKVIRWRLPDGQDQVPESVEVVGTFTHWQKVPLLRDKGLGTWHASFPNIPGHRTHHYMLLVNGQPTLDKHCDGLATPHGPDEERFQLMTPKGPRVFMMFAQTK